MGHALINLKGQQLINEIINGYDTEDAVRSWGSNNVVDGCTIIDSSNSKAAHRDLIQEIAEDDEPNAQMHGAITKGNVYVNNKLSSKYGQLLFSSDGAATDITIGNNICDTKGQHFITMCVLSGKIYDNVDSNNKFVPVVLNPLRCGGNHSKAFYINSFLPSSGLAYSSIDTNQPIDDRRHIPRSDRPSINDFDWVRWRRICKAIHYPHNGFNVHFEACVKEYLHGATETPIDEYYSPTMWIADGHLHVPDRRKLTDYDLAYWQSRWPFFQPYEVDSRDFSILLNVEAFDLLIKLRIEINEPLILTNAWRTTQHNKAVGGSPRSDHTVVEGRKYNGSAYDIAIKNVAMGKRIEKLAVKLGFNAIGRYKSRLFIHISKRKPKTSGRLYVWGSWR